MRCRSIAMMSPSSWRKSYIGVDGNSLRRFVGTPYCSCAANRSGHAALGEGSQPLPPSACDGVTVSAGDLPPTHVAEARVSSGVAGARSAGPAKRMNGLRDPFVGLADPLWWRLL